MNKVVKYLSLFLLSITTLKGDVDLAWTREGKPLKREVKELIKSGGLQAEKDLFLSSFKRAYSHLTHEQLFGETSRCKDLHEFLSGCWQEAEELLLDGTKMVFFVSARDGKKLVGFAMFTQEKNSEVYVDQMAVHPDFWRKGIGRKLVFSILDKLPRLKKINLVTRKLNTISLVFYRGLGFKESVYAHAGYDDRYEGFECVVE